MQKITTHLWFDTQAKEAAGFYTSIFQNARIKNHTVLSDTPSGTVDLLTIELAGQEFTLISAGPLFKFTPAISFLVACKTKEETEQLWGKLSEGGKALMELGPYPFSERYGWVQDKYGLSWQIMFIGDRPMTQKITPTLMFVGDVYGKAEEAINFYGSVFHNSSVGHIMRYEEGEASDQIQAIKHAAFTLEGQEFAAMDGAGEHHFSFTEAISFIVHCETQDEIDYFWTKLSAVPASEQCGWLKDIYGVSWQVVPTIMDEMMTNGTSAQMARVTQAFLKMKKFDIAALELAFQE